jgi:hypothetical protein
MKGISEKPDFFIERDQSRKDLTEIQKQTIAMIQERQFYIILH